MDAKSLELLRQLKTSLTEERRDREWPETTCRFCKSHFRYHHSWKPVPIMCKGCRIERKTPTSPERATLSISKLRSFAAARLVAVAESDLIGRARCWRRLGRGSSCSSSRGPLGISSRWITGLGALRCTPGAVATPLDC